MALENVKETVQLNGESKIEDKTVVVFASRIGEDGISNSVGMNVRDQDMYEANKSQVRRDQQAFQQLVWETEDRLAAKQAEETSK